MSAPQFLTQIKEWTTQAKEQITEIEKISGDKRVDLSKVGDLMFSICGTALQFNFTHIAYISGLGEDVAFYGSKQDTRPLIRKCIGTLWDILTTLDYLVDHQTEETSDEQKILINRLENTLQALGGARPRLTQADIDVLFRSKRTRS